jgi:predicted DNA-binding antitoxin AbrB/MazE fold protein
MKKRRIMRATVKKIIRPFDPKEAEKAEIAIDEAEDLYREIRVENVVADENGKKASLKEGAKVDVVIEADTDATLKKPD